VQTVAVSRPAGPNGWRRRYDQSIVREDAALKESDDLSGAEVVGFESGSWLPGWFGAVVLAITGAAALVRRRGRRQ
jgi:hypothetical protein